MSLIILDPNHIQKINTALLKWFSENKRPLPFREDKHPYKILVSEIMAQQTRMEVLIPYYERFIKKFPDVESLAHAEEEEVLKAWEGLGYYSRARNLLKCAKILSHLEKFPDTYEELLKLPGVGPYTAAAVASIAFGRKTAAVDGNVLRVMSRLHAYNGDVLDPKVKSGLKTELEAFMPETAGAYTEALMEFGALICTPKSPRCQICPVLNLCMANREGLVELLPVKRKKTDKKRIAYKAYIIRTKEELLIEVRGDGDVLSGMIGLPLYNEIDTNIEEKVKCYGILNYLGESRHVFTHKIWVSRVFELVIENQEELSFACELLSSEGGEYKVSSIESLLNEAIPTAFRKMLALSEKFEK